jgi:hypothetical protein
MASKTQEQLLETFVEAASGTLQAWHDAGPSTVDASRDTATDRGNAGAADGYAVSANPAGVNVHSTSAPQSTSDGGGSAGSIVSTFFESGFGVAALVKGLLGLFGSGGESAPPPLEKYAMPSAIHFESAATAGGIGGVEYDQLGRPRASSPENGMPAGEQPTTSAAPQITVNVQTMDAQSFLDHSSQIAEAVRGAMLNMSSINDVVNEL